MLPVQFGSFTGSVFTFLTKYMGWWYMLAVNFFVIFCIVLAFSRFGSLKMGKPDEKPEFSTMSWFAMLFGAGHGVGMVFYGVAEPLINYIVRPFGATDSAQAAEDALRTEMLDRIVPGPEGDWPIGRHTMRVWLATIDEEPECGPDHDELRWCTALETLGLDWLPGDIALAKKLASWMLPAGNHIL